MGGTRIGQHVGIRCVHPMKRSNSSGAGKGGRSPIAASMLTHMKTASDTRSISMMRRSRAGSHGPVFPQHRQSQDGRSAVCSAVSTSTIRASRAAADLVQTKNPRPS